MPGGRDMGKQEKVKEGVSCCSAHTVVYLKMRSVLTRSGLIPVRSDLGLPLNWSANNCFREGNCVPHFRQRIEAGGREGALLFLPGAASDMASAKMPATGNSA